MTMMARWTICWMRLWVTILIGAIALQAVEPVEAGLPSHAGSAFSASTLDVAVTTVRRGEVQAPSLAPLPPLLPSAPVAHMMVAAVRGEPFADLVPLARGPPPRERPERSPDPRAPPFA